MDVKYLALSHCWGNGVPQYSTTTLDTLDTHLRGILTQSLTRNFEDICLLARRLGVAYVWIDSLCIIQDSIEDWTKESALMGKIFSHSYWDEVNTGFLASRSSKNEAYNHCPLRKRGWTLQERELSFRSVFYTEQQMIWECQSFQATEQSPVPREHDNASFRLFPLHPRIPLYYQTNRYTRRQLSYQTDKLPAISGLAGAFEATTRITKYAAGLCEEDLLERLLWCVSPPNRYSYQKEGTGGKYQYPSWSWASVNDPAVWLSKHHRWPLERHVEDGAVPATHPHIKPSILELETIPFGSDPRGRISESSLRVEGILRKVSEDKHLTWPSPQR
ncbi:HET domain containing protein [Hyaloscypha variabilis]